MMHYDEAFLDAAARIGAGLCRDALWAGNRCNWLGDSMEPVGAMWTIAHRAFGPEVYNGTGGIALCLGQLYRLTGELPYRLTAEGALQHALSRLDDIDPRARIGFYSGTLGIAYVATLLGRIFAQEGLIERGLSLVDELGGADLFDAPVDVIGGAAGAIPAVLHLYRTYRREQFLDLAVRLGEYVLATARESAAGWSWNTPPIPTNSRDLTGFGHGAAGIAWGLLELYQETRLDRFRDAAVQAIRYEQHWYSAEQQNWPDFRNMDPATEAGAPGYMIAWCHGAAGIGLARLRAYQILGVDAYREQAEVALRTTAQSLEQAAGTVQGNYSLCHGLAGNADLLLYASQVLGDAAYRERAEEVGRRGIVHYHQRRVPWPCGVLGGGETPNLMLGLAGIAYFYLRLHDPVRTPPVLILAPPDEAAGQQQLLAPESMQ